MVEGLRVNTLSRVEPKFSRKRVTPVALLPKTLRLALLRRL